MSPASATACSCAPVAPEYALTFDRIGADDESVSTRCKRLFRPVRLCRHRLCLRQSSRCLCIELGCARTRRYRIPHERMRALPCHYSASAEIERPTWAALANDGAGQIKTQILKGGHGMPPFGNVLSKDEVKDSRRVPDVLPHGYCAAAAAS